MQDLEPGLYEAEWGCYRMTAAIRDGHRCGGELVIVHDDKTETRVLACVDTDGPGLIKSFVEYLEQHLGVALIDGKKTSIEDFLVFKKLEKVLH